MWEGSVREVVHRAKLRPAIVVGNSRGGGLAMDLALAHPDHVAGLVLVAPSASGYPEEERVSAAAELEQDAMIEQAGDAGDLAHCPSLDQPDEPNRLVLEFAKSIEAWSSETS